MAKRADSQYASEGRSADWLKIKTAQRQEVVIAGFTAPRRTRPFFGALVLAVREAGTWRYIGRVGAGFSHKTLEQLHARMSKLKAAKSPFPTKVKEEAATTWIRPLLVAEVKFAEWTSKGELRQPVFLGLPFWACGPTRRRRTSCGRGNCREVDAARCFREPERTRSIH